MMIRRVALIAFFALSPAFACLAAEARVVVSIRPLALILRAVAGDGITIDTLPGVGASPHDFVLKPSALQELRGGALFVWMGPALERPLERLLQRDPSIHALALMPELGLDAHQDPHVWLDPQMAIAMAGVMQRRLLQSGLADASVNDPGLARFESAMQTSAAELDATLSGLQDVPFIVMHDGLRSFVARFGLRQVGALSAGHEIQPGVRSVARLRRTAIESGARCLFREPGDNAALARTLSEGTSMHVVELDLLASRAADTPDGFANFLHALGHDVAACLRGTTPEPN